MGRAPDESRYAEDHRVVSQSADHLRHADELGIYQRRVVRETNPSPPYYPDDFNAWGYQGDVRGDHEDEDVRSVSPLLREVIISNWQRSTSHSVRASSKKFGGIRGLLSIFEKVGHARSEE